MSPIAYIERSRDEKKMKESRVGVGEKKKKYKGKGGIEI